MQDGNVICKEKSEEKSWVFVLFWL